MEQDNCLFQIDVTPNKDMMKECYGAMYWRTWRTAVACAVAAFCFWVAGQDIYRALYWNSQGVEGALSLYLPWGLFLLCLGVGYLVLIFLTPSLTARRYMKQLASLYGDSADLSVSYRFEDDKLHMLDINGGIFDTAYDQFVKVRETANCVILVRKARLFHVLDKSRIAGGSLEEFRAFLEQKMPGAKIHWKR